MNNRRKLVVALGAGTLLAPFGTFGQQQGRLWRVGFLSSRSRPASLDSDVFGAFRLRMRELGYMEGKNLVIEWRFTDSKFERLPDLAAELVRLKVDVIVTETTPAALAAKRATATIPIVMASGGDAVGAGIIASLARPGGNVTGNSFMLTQLSAKYVQLLKELVPSASRMAFLGNSALAPERLAFKEVETAAQTLGMKAKFMDASSASDLDGAFAEMIRWGAEVLIVMPNAIYSEHRAAIIQLAARHRIPAEYGRPEFVEAGGLMSYGPSFSDLFRRAAYFVDRILKGANPGDLPVEQPMTFELVVNLKTAKALGITIPPPIMVQATKVIR